MSRAAAGPGIVYPRIVDSAVSLSFTAGVGLDEHGPARPPPALVLCAGSALGVGPVSQQSRGVSVRAGGSDTHAAGGRWAAGPPHRAPHVPPCLAPPAPPPCCRPRPNWPSPSSEGRVRGSVRSPKSRPPEEERRAPAAPPVVQRIHWSHGVTAVGEGCVAAGSLSLPRIPWGGLQT